LQRLGLDYVDIFYSHRFDADTPLEETAAALASSVQQGKALYVGISSYDGPSTLEIARLLNEWKIPLLIHQPVYNLFNRALERGTLDAIEQVGAGAIVFSPLAQGLLTNKYLNGTPSDSRVGRGSSYFVASDISADKLERVRKLNDIAQGRGQSLAQLALAWVLRDKRVTSALIGASTAAQVRENVATLDNLQFTPEELVAIDAITGF
jgi:L-glyceraldehyde 3-phosphate reductase